MKYKEFILTPIDFLTAKTSDTESIINLIPFVRGEGIRAAFIQVVDTPTGEEVDYVGVTVNIPGSSYSNSITSDPNANQPMMQMIDKPFNQFGESTFITASIQVVNEELESVPISNLTSGRWLVGIIYE